MDEYRSRRHDRPRKYGRHANSDGANRLLPGAEDQILRSILDRSPLPKALNLICSALDYDIGNVVSLISLRDDDGTDLGTVAGNAERFGLYRFCSAGIFAESDELLGSLEIYCCVPRKPSPEEFESIEWATSLAAIAFELDQATGCRGACYRHSNQPAPERALGQSAYVN